MKCANKKLTFSYLWPNVNFLLGQQCTLVRPLIPVRPLGLTAAQLMKC